MRYLSSPKKIASEVTSLRINDKNSLATLIFYLALLIALIYPFLIPNKAGATVTESFVRFDRHSTGAAISGTACLNTSTSGTETAVVIDFPQDWTISQTASNWTVTTTNLPTAAGGGSATAWPGINTATSVTGVSVAFPSTDLSTGTFYCFNFAGASSTIGASGNDKTGALKTEGGSPYVDQVNWATSVVTSNADQITVTASVSAQMTFSLGANSVALGTLSSSSVVSDAGITQTVATNARNGWISWVQSANGSLDSVVASDSISSPGTSNGTPESLAAQAGYVLDVNAGTGTPTIAAEFDGADTNSGGHLATTFQQTATNGAPTAGDTATLIVRAKSGATNAAANDYTDTLTVVAAGSF